MSLNKHEFEEWLEHPGTLELRRWLEARRESIKHDWEMGNFTTADFQSSCLKNAENVGRCDAFMDVEALDYETMERDLYGE